MKWLKDKYWKWIEKQYRKKYPPPKIVPTIYNIEKRNIYQQRFIYDPMYDQMPNISELKYQFVNDNIDNIIRSVHHNIVDTGLWINIDLTMYVGELTNDT